MYITAASPRDFWAVCNILNAAARLITGLGRQEHVTPVLWQLHWLPVHQHVMFKLATLVYRSLAGTTMAYLSDECRITSSVEVRSLRSADVCVYLVANTMVTVFAVLPLPVLVCGTVCRCSFENLTFNLSVVKLCWRRFWFRWQRSVAICDKDVPDIQSDPVSGRILAIRSLSGIR